MYLSLKWDTKGRVKAGTCTMSMNGKGIFRVNAPEGWGVMEMEALGPGETYKCLGVDITGDGTWKLNTASAQKKLEYQVGAIMAKCISAEGAWLVSNTVLKPQVLYRCFVTAGAKKAIDGMERLVRKFFCKNAKLPRTVSLDLLSAHEKRGLGWVRLLGGIP